MRGKLPVRGTDSQGSGHYLASRGSRTHNGIDYACLPGTGIYPTTAGRVTKLGKPYRDNPATPDVDEFERYDYVQITDIDGNQHRYFYVQPLVRLGAFVTTDTVIGVTQALHYEGITQHCHYEIKKDGAYIDPSRFA